MGRQHLRCERGEIFRRFDSSAIPDIGTAYVQRAALKLTRASKLVSIRRDTNVMDRYKTQGKGNQARINEVLAMDRRANAG